MSFFLFLIILIISRCPALPAEPPIFSHSPEQEGKHWWAGFLCKMTHGLHEWMGRKVRDSDHVSPWMALKSTVGGAYMPSKELMEFFELAEHKFKEVNGDTLSLAPNPIKRVSSLLMAARPDIDVEIIEAYSRARFYLRLNDLNIKQGVREKQIRRKNATHKNKYI